MDLRIYERFLVVVEAGTLKAAAETLAIDASSLGKQMRILEEEYGPLFTSLRRGRQKLELTDGGRRVYTFTKQMLRQMANLKTETDNLKYGDAQTLKLAVVPGLSQMLYTQFLTHIASCFPQASFYLLETNVEQQENIIRQSQAELGFTNSSLQHPWEFDILVSTPMAYSIVCRKDTRHLDTTVAGYTLSEIATVPLCLTVNSSRRLYKAFDEAKLHPHVVSFNTMRQTSIHAAKLDLGVTVYPTNATPQDSDLMAIPLIAPGLTSEQIVYKSKSHELSPMAKALVALYRAAQKTEERK